MTTEQTAIRTAYFSMASNAILAIVKGAAGFLGNSFALIADAIESTNDFFSSALVLLGMKYANRPADENHPYGHGRIEPLVTFIIVGFLIASATVIAIKSIHNIRTPHPLPESWTLLVLGVIIIWKEVSFQIIHRKGKETKSSSLVADAWHHRGDAITSVAAFIGILVALLLGEGFETADDWAALLASTFIFYNSYKIFRPALGEIMDEHTHEDLVDKIKTVSFSVDGLISVEKCFVRKAGLKFHVDIYATVDGKLSVKEGHDIAHKIEDALRIALPQLGNILIHIEPA